MKKLLFYFMLAVGMFAGPANAVNNCNGATYYDSNSGTCIACPTGYDYDTETGKTSITQCQIHCNGGTYVETYTELEYLTSTGSQYIDSGVMFELSKDFRVVGSVINPDASYRKIIVGNFFYGDSVDGGVYSIEFGGSVNSKPGHLRNYLAINGHINYGLWSSSALPVNTSISYDSTYDASNRRITNILEYDGISVSYDFSTISQSGSTSRSLRFFLDYRPDNGVIANPVSIGKTQMYKAGILVGDFVPTKRNSDNVLGMYDKVTNTFLTNSGTGIFIAGPYAGEMGTCTNVGPGYYAAASTVNFGSTGTRTACPVGLHTVGYGHGADEANDCGRILHIGNYRFYAHRNKQTTPSINIMVGNERFYISLSPTDHNMSKLHLMHNGTKYTAYDDSLLYGERDFDTGQQVVQ